MTALSASTPYVNIQAATLGTPNQPRGKNIDQTAQDFESMVLAQMLSEMTKTVKPDKNFGGGAGEEIFRSFLNSEYAKAMAQAGGIGLADNIKAQIIRLQGEPQPATPIAGA